MKQVAVRGRIIVIALLLGVLPGLAGLAVHLAFGDTLVRYERLHEGIEVAGGCISLVVASLLLLRTRHEQTVPHLLWAAAALIAMGGLDSAHALSSVGPAWGWLRNGATLAGGLLLGLVWLPVPTTLRRRPLWILPTALAALALSEAIGQRAAWLPAPWIGETYTLTSRAVNAVGALGFLASAVFFLRRYQRQTQAEDLVFGGSLLLFAAASLLMVRPPLWTGEWWFWHGVRLGAYLLLLGAAWQILVTLYAQVSQHAEERRQASAYHRSLLEASLDPLVTIDPAGRITDVNAATEAVTGRPRAALIGTDFCDYFTDPMPARAGYEQVFRDGTVRDYALALQHQDGHVTQVLYNASVYRDETGNVTGVFAAARDVTARQRAEAAARTERQRFNNVLEMLPAYVVLLTPDYQVAFANRFFEERFGRSNGRRCYEYLFHRTEPCENCETYKVLKTHSPHRWEWTGPDGRNYDIHDFPFAEADGSPLIMEMGVDITARKQAEAELRRANRALRTLSDCNQALVRARTEPALLDEICRIIVEVGGYRFAWVGFAESDPERNVRPVAYAGHEAGYLAPLKITWADTERGRGPTGTAIRSGQPVVCRDFRTDPSVALWREAALQRGYAASLVVPLLQGSQAFGAVSIYASEPGAFDDPEVELLTKLVANLAFGVLALRARLDRQRAQEALRRANAYNRSLIEASLDPLVTFGPDGKITDANAATEAVTGRSRGELIGTDFSDYFTEPAQARAGYQQVFREGTVRDYALELRHRDGHVTSVLYNASVYRDEAGQIIGVFAAARDVTARQRAEAEIRRLNAELEERVQQRTAELRAVNQELEAFTYSVSHDLRAPLRHLTGYSELLREEALPVLSPKGLHFLEVIGESGRRMGALVDDLLAFSRSSRVEMRTQTLPLGDLVQEVLTTLRPDWEGRRVVWKLGTFPAVRADSTLLRLVLTNLMANALKFTRPRPEAHIQIQCTESDKETVCCIRDNGVGFDPRYADKLFGVFQRLHSRDEFEGTGIGLANVRRIVQRHGGRTWAEGAVNAGAAFYFSLPKAEIHPNP